MVPFCSDGSYEARPPEQIAEAQTLLQLIALGWGKDDPAFRQLYTSQFIPDGTTEQFRAFNDSLRRATSPENAAHFLRELQACDLRTIAPQVRCPTLVLHGEDRRVPLEQGRALAAAIPNSRFVPLDSRNHYPLPHEPAWRKFVEELNAFLPGAGSASATPGLTLIDGFTRREHQVLDLVAQGIGNVAIGDRRTARHRREDLLASPPPPLVVNQSLFAKLASDPGAFVPVTVLCRVPNVLVAHPSVPATTVEALLAFARLNPDWLNYASTGNGGTPHLTSERLKTIAGLRIVHVPYKGLSHAVIDLLAGQVDIMFAPLPGVAQHIKEGKLKALAVAGPSRIAELPGAPAVQETLPGFTSETWYAVVAPPNTPRENRRETSAPPRVG